MDPVTTIGLSALLIFTTIWLAIEAEINSAWKKSKDPLKLYDADWLLALRYAWRDIREIERREGL